MRYISVLSITILLLAGFANNSLADSEGSGDKSPDYPDAPNIRGLNLEDDEVFNLGDYDNGLVLLDFAYMSCHYCTQLAPSITEIYNELKGKGVKVFWIDSWDKANKKMLPDYVKENKINYPVILTEPRVDIQYNVKLYPTCFLINKGKIVYKKVGYYPGMADTLREAINRVESLSR